VKIVEVMGRNAGWLPAAAALARERPADAPQIIFLPERPRPLAQMVEEVHAAHRAGRWVVVVISENQRDEAGEALAGSTPVYVDPHGHPYYDSSGAALARAVQATGLRARYERPGSLQRTSAAALSDADVDEAWQVGAEAARRALAGESDVMVAIKREQGATYAIQLGVVPLEEVAHQERRLPGTFIAPSGTDVTEAFLDYARPLLGGPLPRLWRTED
jgi:6-phosphofructokinase 1